MKEIINYTDFNYYIKYFIYPERKNIYIYKIINIIYIY